jgi:hypothetical protein
MLQTKMGVIKMRITMGNEMDLFGTNYKKR